MLKTKQLFTASSKETHRATFRKNVPFLIHHRKDKTKRMDTQFTESHPPGPPRVRSFLRNGLINENSRTVSVNSNNPESFQCAIGPILGFAQLFGILPVSGISAPTPLKLKFAIFSFRTLYAVSIIIMILFMPILAIIHVIKTLDSSTFEIHGGISTAIFYGNNIMSLMIFLWLSPRWVTLQRDWGAMEQFIDSNKVERPKLCWRFYLITATILFWALVEDILNIAMNTETFYWNGNLKNTTFKHFLEIYCMSSHAFIMEQLNYNLALGIFIFIVNKLTKFTWNFTDVFIMLVATGLAERYKTLNKQVTTSALKHGITDWCGLREDYAALSCMVKKVDNNISPIILLSFANNFYFISLQLLNGLSQSTKGIINYIYFFGSFVFLIGRTVVLTLLTARINDQSKIILPKLYTCSSSTYNIETERLIYQLSTDDISLTGLGFFSITRNFMLAVAGVIITYEIVLLQFNVSMNKSN